MQGIWILCWCVQLWMMFCHNSKIGKGKLLSAWLYKPLGLSKTSILAPTLVRLGQLLVLIVCDILFMSTSWYWYGVIALYLDDYFSSDKDWKKKWDTVKNKIKWKQFAASPLRPVKVGS